MAVVISQQRSRPLVPPTGRTAARRRCLILANPKAGALQIREHLARLAHRVSVFLGNVGPDPFSESFPAVLPILAEMAGAVGLEAYVEPVPERSKMPDVLKAAEQAGYDTVVAAGGDGTAHAVAQGLVGTSLRMGILPVGTANNFAHSLGIPFQLEAALRVLAEGVERKIDVGKLGNEYFVEAAGVGLFAEMMHATSNDELRRYQIIRAARIVMPLLWNPPAHRLRLTLDGVEQQEDAIMVTVANSIYLGESLPISPHASMSDGLFDVIVVGALTRAEMLPFARALMQGRHLELPKVQCVQARRVEIQRARFVNRPLPVHVDDHTGAYTPASMEIVPQALRILVPSESL